MHIIFITRSVLQGLNLEPVLCNTSINDLDAAVGCILSKLADDTELGCTADSLEGWEALQRDLGRLKHWAINNSMKFNKGKCMVFCTWDRVTLDRCTDKWLESYSAERDLEVLMTAGSARAGSTPWQPKRQTASQPTSQKKWFFCHILGRCSFTFNKVKFWGKKGN